MDFTERNLEDRSDIDSGLVEQIKKEHRHEDGSPVTLERIDVSEIEETVSTEAKPQPKLEEDVKYRAEDKATDLGGFVCSCGATFHGKKIEKEGAVSYQVNEYSASDGSDTGGSYQGSSFGADPGNYDNQNVKY